MREIYNKVINRTEAATPTMITYDDRIPAGKILVIRNLCATFVNMGTSEDARFFVEIGQVIHYLSDDKPSTTDGMASWSGCVPIGEGARLGVYTAASASAEVISFWVVGELWDANKWRDPQS